MIAFSGSVVEQLWYGTLTLPPSLMIGINANVNFRGWLDGNAKRLQHEEPKIVTNVPFISTMWSIW